MLHVLFFTDVEGCPARIRDPTVLFCETFCQERVAPGARKRNVNNSTRMNVSNFCISDTEFLRGKAVWLNRNLRPRSDLILKSFQGFHCPSVLSPFDVPRSRPDSSEVRAHALRISEPKI